MKPPSSQTLDPDAHNHKESLTALNVPDLISILRTAYRTVDYDRVEEALVAKESKLKTEIATLREKLEKETQAKVTAEEQLKKYKVESERGKKAEERYEKLLQSVKNNNINNNKGLGDGKDFSELRSRNRKLEDEKRRIESEVESWKRKCEELSERFLTSLNDDDDVDEVELNEVVKRAVRSGNTPSASFPSQRNGDLVNFASETVQLEAEGTMPDTEEGHDDRSISKQYYTRSQRQGSHNDVQDSSGKSFWGNMLEWQEEVAKINKKNRGKRTTREAGRLKTQASKKAKMDTKHQRKINGDEVCIEVNNHKDAIASPTVPTNIDTIIEKQYQVGSYDEAVFDGQGDVSTPQPLVMIQHNPEPSESVHETGSTPSLNQMLDDYKLNYLTPSNEKGTSLGKQLEKLKALNSMFSQVIKNPSEL